MSKTRGRISSLIFGEFGTFPYLRFDFKYSHMGINELTINY